MKTSKAKPNALLSAFFPNERLLSVFEITPTWLNARQLQGLILDLDNTLVPYGAEIQEPALLNWLIALRTANIQACLVSNAMPERIARWSKQLGLPAVGAFGAGTAAKPFPAAFVRASRMMQLKTSHVCVVGDQLFTDILGGNLIGAYTVLVTPLSNNALPHTRFVRNLERFVLTRDPSIHHLASQPSRR